MHFLWKQITESNQHKRRVIFEHIRDRIPEMTGYLFENLLCQTSLFISEPDKFFTLPVEDQKVTLEINTPIDYTFKYEIGLQPSFTLSHIESKPNYYQEEILIGERLIN